MIVNFIVPACMYVDMVIAHMHNSFIKWMRDPILRVIFIVSYRKLTGCEVE